MQNLHEKIGLQLIEATQKYMDGEIELDDLKKVQEKERLVCEYERWNQIKRELKESIFKALKSIFTDINECDKNIQILKKINESKEIECEIDSLISHSFLLSRNRAPKPGFEHSNWYLGPYPSFQMNEALIEEDDHQ